MRGRRHWRIGVAVLVAAVGIAGCGGSGGGDSTKDALLAGVDGVAGADRLTTTIRLDTTPADLQQLAKAGSNDLDPTIASAISSADIVIETVRGDDGTAVDLKAVAGGSTLVELRAVNDTLYIQGDVEGIFALIGKESSFTGLKAQTKSMPTFVQDAVNGEWVSLPASTLTSLSNLGGGSSSSAPGKGAKLLADLRRSIDRHVTATEAGTDSQGTHYVLHADLRDLANDLRAAAQSSIPGGALLSQRLPSNVSHKQVAFDAWVQDGALTQLSIDLTQFSDTKSADATKLPLVVTFDRAGADITPPSGATPVDLTQLSTLVGALMGGG
jgi:hypothetical protein